jgi:hypothetical protein
MLVMVLVVLLKRMLMLMLELMLVLELRLGMRRVLLQLLDALLNVIRSIGVDVGLALGLRIDGLTELTELRELQLLLLLRVQQLLLAGRRVESVMLLAVRLRVAGHLVVHGRGRGALQAAELWQSVYTFLSLRTMSGS